MDDRRWMIEDRGSKIERMTQSSILDPLSSVFYLVYYIGGSVALTWAGNYLTTATGSD
jgi:hypothetical protein